MIRIPLWAALLSSALPLSAQAPTSRPIDLAICLDTSGSMEGLIDAARRHLWAIVNDLALADPAPRLRVALLTYGNDGHPQDEGWVRVDSPFTDDLDAISQALFALSTNGGTELVARVLDRAVTLDWNPSQGALRLILVAGNESAEQDPQISIDVAAKAAIEHGILVDAIYCGPAADDLAPGWQRVATLADGQFATIDHDHQTVAIATPFDTELAELSTALNATYVPYGTQWTVAQANQVVQDRNAAKVDGATAAQRAICKASSNYTCAGWDLVDGLRDGRITLEKVERDRLPEALRTMSTEDLAAHVAAKREERTELQQRIAELGQKRAAFVAAERAKLAKDDREDFDLAVRAAIRAQAEAIGFAFPAVAGR